LQLAGPLFVVAVLLGIATFAWNEVVVPYCTERSRYIDIVEIRNKPLKALLSEDGIWFHGRTGIYNIEHFDARTGTLVGLTVYDFTPQFELKRLVEIPTAQWRDDRWMIAARSNAPSTTRAPSSRAARRRRVRASRATQDFQIIEKDPEELNFAASAITSGAQPQGHRHHRVARRSASQARAAAGAARDGAGRRPARRAQSRAPPLATSIGIGLVVGFSYWVLLALTISLGHGGAIPPRSRRGPRTASSRCSGAFLFLGPE
jgi:lipopolysaccharide export LptBFGC system permease protein LptF